MNGLSLLLVVAIVIGVVVAYRAGVARGARVARGTAPLAALTSDPIARQNARNGSAEAGAQARAQATAAPGPAPDAMAGAPAPEAGAATLPPAPADTVDTALAAQAPALIEERHALFRALADARAETARYRQLVVDLEDNAPPPLLDSPAAPDDLKLIVGIGPVLERMLQQMGVSRYRQIARWTERDIDEFDARLHEFPGRIRRDAWVTQARALHQSKYGEALPPR